MQVNTRAPVDMVAVRFVVGHLLSWWKEGKALWLLLCITTTKLLCIYPIGLGILSNSGKKIWMGVIFFGWWLMIPTDQRSARIYHSVIQSFPVLGPTCLTFTGHFIWQSRLIFPDRQEVTYFIDLSLYSAWVEIISLDQSLGKKFAVFYLLLSMM